MATSGSHTEASIPLILKVRNIIHESSTIIYVPSTLSQKELYQRVRELQGFPPRESFALRLGGMSLQTPSARLSDSKAKPYSILSCELISLCGGSDKVIDKS